MLENTFAAMQKCSEMCSFPMTKHKVLIQMFDIVLPGSSKPNK